MEPLTTLADIRRNADTDVPVTTGTSDATPEGTFYAGTHISGIWTVYLLAGDVDDPSAPVLGRIEHAQTVSAYRGSSLKGGRFIGHTGERDAFAAMLDYAQQDGILAEPQVTAVEALQSLRNWIADHSAEAIDRQLLKRQIDLRIADLGGRGAFAGRRGHTYHMKNPIPGGNPDAGH